MSLAAALGRGRPPTFTARAGLLEEFRCLARAAGLAHHLALPADPTAGWPWPDMLLALLRQAEARDWFEPDRLRLQTAWAAQRAGDPRPLAAALDFIPLQLYGLELLEWSHPPLALLQLALAPQFLTSSRREAVLAYLALPPALAGALQAWTGRDQRRAWRYLRRLEADGAGPARQLPGLGRWVAAASGNPILDTPPPDDLVILTYPWERLADCRSAWQQAKPLLDQADRLLAWHQQNPDHLAFLAHALLKGVAYDRLTW